MFTHFGDQSALFGTSSSHGLAEVQEGKQKTQGPGSELATADIPLAKVSHMAKPKVKTVSLSSEELQSHTTKMGNQKE